MGDVWVEVCPAAAELEQKGEKNIPCPVIGCDRLLPHSSALRFHLVKVHRIIKVGYTLLLYGYTFKSVLLASVHLKMHVFSNPCDCFSKMIRMFL